MSAKSLTGLIHQLEILFDRFKGIFPGKAPVHIQLYYCFGTRSKVFLKGRVLEKKRILPETSRERLWVNFYNAFQRYESDEIPFAQLRLLFDGQEQFVASDEEGYFEARLFLPELSDEKLATLRIRLELLEPVRPGRIQPALESHPTFILEDCRLGIISDIDDTIVRTDVLKPLKMLVNIFLKSSRSRQSFPGTSAFYLALSAGCNNNEKRPVFYVSTSPWNLFDILVEYLGYQGFPADPILYLRDWGITENEILPIDNFDHKCLFIQSVLELLPGMHFILIGDNGQQDPEIYAGIVDDYEGRILAIYLREVTGNPQRIESVHRLRARLARRGVPVVLAESVLPMAEHAAGQGWIFAEAIDRVRAQVQPH